MKTISKAALGLLFALGASGFAGQSQAAPLGAGVGAHAGNMQSETLIAQVQQYGQHGGMRPGGPNMRPPGGGRPPHVRPPMYRPPHVRPPMHRPPMYRPPVYGRPHVMPMPGPACWQRRPVLNRFGVVVGYRRVRVC